MQGRFESAGQELACHITTPAGRDGPLPGLILCHGFPMGPLDARRSAGAFPELIDRIAHDVGYVAMTFTFRGCGDSAGDFSLQGWIDDLRAAIDHLVTTHEVTHVVLIGTNTGGSIAICVAADDPRVLAAALLSPAPISMTGPSIPAGSWTTPVRSARSGPPRSRPHSMIEAGRFAGSAPPWRPGGLPPGRC